MYYYLFCNDITDSILKLLLYPYTLVLGISTMTEKRAGLIAKKKYSAPKIKSLGNVKTLTLKTGSSVVGFGTFG